MDQHICLFYLADKITVEQLQEFYYRMCSALGYDEKKFESYYLLYSVQYHLFDGKELTDERRKVLAKRSGCKTCHYLCNKSLSYVRPLDVENNACILCKWSSWYANARMEKEDIVLRRLLSREYSYDKMLFVNPGMAFNSCIRLCCDYAIGSAPNIQFNYYLYSYLCDMRGPGDCSKEEFLTDFVSYLRNLAQSGSSDLTKLLQAGFSGDVSELVRKQLDRIYGIDINMITDAMFDSYVSDLKDMYQYVPPEPALRGERVVFSSMGNMESVGKKKSTKQDFSIPSSRNNSESKSFVKEDEESELVSSDKTQQQDKSFDFQDIESISQEETGKGFIPLPDSLDCYESPPVHVFSENTNTNIDSPGFIVELPCEIPEWAYQEEDEIQEADISESISIEEIPSDIEDADIIASEQTVDASGNEPASRATSKDSIQKHQISFCAGAADETAPHCTVDKGYGFSYRVDVTGSVSEGDIIHLEHTQGEEFSRGMEESAYICITPAVWYKQNGFVIYVPAADVFYYYDMDIIGRDLWDVSLIGQNKTVFTLHTMGCTDILTSHGCHYQVIVSLDLLFSQLYRLRTYKELEEKVCKGAYGINCMKQYANWYEQHFSRINSSLSHNLSIMQLLYRILARSGHAAILNTELDYNIIADDFFSFHYKYMEQMDIHRYGCKITVCFPSGTLQTEYKPDTLITRLLLIIGNLPHKYRQKTYILSVMVDRIVFFFDGDKILANQFYDIVMPEFQRLFFHECGKPLHSHTYCTAYVKH